VVLPAVTLSGIYIAYIRASDTIGNVGDYALRLHPHCSRERVV
jgi:hypothetical protein